MISPSATRRLTRPARYLIVAVLALSGCGKADAPQPPAPPAPPANLALTTWAINGQPAQPAYHGVSANPSISLSFNAPVNRASVNSNVAINEGSGARLAYATAFQNGDSTLVLQPGAALSFLKAHAITLATGLQSAAGGSLAKATTIPFNTGIDSSDKFPPLSNEALLDLVQRQTFNYFWAFGHPVSGLARERNTSGDVVTSGGSGFGVMAILAGMHRSFITRAQGLERLQTIVAFLKTKAQTFHGAFPHWLNGATGAVVPFSQKDDGADLVETAYLMQGLLAARQYFSNNDAAETTLRADINALWNAVEWRWFRRGGENVLYWHWSPQYEWQIAHRISGWNEAFITYVLAASSPAFPIPKEVYDEGWAANGGMKNGNSYFGTTLPLGPAGGGPLFFEHYSFLGINPNNLKDAYADYGQQAKAHALINFNHCVANAQRFYGYSPQCWGLTASDDMAGYAVHEPVNDNGVIAPTAALASLPFAPEQSMQALRFFYYKLGNKIWGDYGFTDAFSLHHLWFANSFLATDQGPIIIMIENYRSGLLWNLVMSCPEVKAGLRKLQFTSPYL